MRLRLGADHSPAGASPAEHRGAAFEVLRAAAGRELDPRVVEALAGMLDRVTRR